MNIELLAPDKWDEVAGAFAHTDEPLPPPEHSVMLVARDGDRIVGVVGLQTLACASPLWVAPEYRGNGIAEALAKRVVEIVGPTGMQGMVITSNPFVEKLLFSVGMIPLAGAVWRMKDG